MGPRNAFALIGWLVRTTSDLGRDREHHSAACLQTPNSKPQRTSPLFCAIPFLASQREQVRQDVGSENRTAIYAAA